MESHKNWREDFDAESPEALKAAARLALAFNVLLQAPFPADFPMVEERTRSYLKEYRCWHEEQLLPLREILFELLRAPGEPPPISPATVH
jgi:hypothetical protein